MNNKPDWMDMLLHDCEVDLLEEEAADDGLGCCRGMRSALLIYAVIGLVGWFAWRVLS